MSIKVGDRVRINTTRDSLLKSIIGLEGIVVSPEDDGWHFDWKVRLDAQPEDLTSFFDDELEVIA